jgi:hypothetical protein
VLSGLISESGATKSARFGMDPDFTNLRCLEGREEGHVPS